MVDYEFTQLNVTIREVRLGNKRLTKTVFNQVESESCFNKDMDFVGDTIIGYIRDKDDKVLLWVNDGKLRKSRLTPYYLLPKEANYAALSKVDWFLRKCKINFDETDDNKATVSLTTTDPKLYEALVKKVRNFLNALVDKQIFL